MTAPVADRGVALLAVLFALTLLMLLALPFAVSMNAGAGAAVREIEAAQVAQASASVRDKLLADAALSHPLFDPTPAYDSVLEWPGDVELPPAFAALCEDGRVTLGGSVEDLQRRIALDPVSPLVLANLLGTAVRLAEPLEADAGAMVVDRTEALPDSGYLWLAGELVRYGQKDENRLLDLERGLLLELGFRKPDATYDEQTLALDYRCVLAVTWPYTGRVDGAAGRRRPYGAVGELADVARAGFGGFTQQEIDRFELALEPAGLAERAATWGRPERVFDELVPGTSRVLRVKSALHVGAGSTVRLCDLATGTVEYGLVMSASSERTVRDLQLPSVFRLALLMPVSHAFPAGDTVVEPLVPAPVNVNTASREVLVALAEGIRRATDVVVHEADGRLRSAPPRPFARGEAGALADEILALRAEAGGPGAGPFTGWQDFVTRLLRPKLETGGSPEQQQRWVYLYRNLRTGRDSVVEMGTAPICFDSGPWVRIRAAASRQRSAVATGVAARHERTCIAAAIPGYRFDLRWATQQQFEEALVLDRRAPYWTTTPVNLGAILPGDAGNDPAGRYFAHLVALAFPGAGLGAPRYPATGEADAGILPAFATAPLGNWGFRTVHAAASFFSAVSPRGHDLARDGAFLMTNTGPTGGGAGAQQGGRRHDGIAFPFSGDNGFLAPFALQFWLEPQTLEGVTVFDHGDGDTERNRCALRGEEGKLVLELLDEAGLDPEPSQSPAGVERTAVAIELPLAELGLPADTAVHCHVAAMTGRPAGVTLHVDGMPRGKRKFVTFLTAAIPEFDPSLASNQGMPPTAGNERYLELQVDDTDGFPPVGTLRIGTELFEYTSINGNAFVCAFRDSIGGRGARQVASEHRPDIPVDAEGRPTIDIDDLRAQGINVDVFPSHPAGAEVALYGYSAPLSADSPMMAGETTLAEGIGQFAVARAFLQSGLRPISLTFANRTPIQIGDGIDEQWTGDLELAAPRVPVAPDTTFPPEVAPDEIANAFPASGGYALLIQRRMTFESNINGVVSVSESSGGVEVIKFASRQGTTLKNVQRAQTIAGEDRFIDARQYDGTARKFVMNWEDWPWDPAEPQVFWDNIPTLMLFVVPITLPLVDTGAVWDPQRTGLSEWVQLYPEGGDPDDTEWVRYDAIADGRHIARGNRRAWENLRYALTSSNQVTTVQVGPLGPGQTPGDASLEPWGTVAATADYIGYVPRLESDYPVIYHARRALRFRGDPLTGTTSHPHSGSTVMQCQRLDLSRWGNYSAFGARMGRHDRIAIVDGSEANGSRRPYLEWKTVNWCARRFNSDNLAQNADPAERLGPWPFQLVAFTDGVRGGGGLLMGPPGDQGFVDARTVDRIVKFPSGELPAAYCAEVPIGSGVGNLQPVTGFVDEVDVVQHGLAGLVVEEAFVAAARTFRVHLDMTLEAQGPMWWQNNHFAGYPQQGGLLQVDGELIAYQSAADGEFTVATNGRGMLGTEPRDHDRGAHVLFLTGRPVAILGAAVAARDEVLPVQALGALPQGCGTVALGQEILHYTWVRAAGDAAQLEMPRWHPPGERGTRSLARGLFRGRYGTTPQGGSSGEALVQWPFRYWDRYAENSDDPELAYCQLTSTSAPTWFRTLHWREEVRDDSVDVVGTVRTDSLVPWEAMAGEQPGLWRFTQNGSADDPLVLAAQGSRIELRFQTMYRPGALDLATMRAHGWKTSARITEVVVDCEGEPRIGAEQVTLR